MHIAFAILFFLFVGLGETLRYGFFGLSPMEITIFIAGALALSALIILRGDIVFALRPSRHDLYGEARLGWSWKRTFLGLTLGPVLWLLPIAFGLAVLRADFLLLGGDTLIRALLGQILLLALAEELFFREAAIKAFSSDTRAIYLISGLAVFIYSIPLGIPAAMIAAGAGLYYLTLRLIGTNILVVALIHGATSVVFAKVVSLGLTARAEWVYAGYFLAGSAVLSAALYQLFGQKRRVYVYA